MWDGRRRHPQRASSLAKRLEVEDSLTAVERIVGELKVKKPELGKIDLCGKSLKEFAYNEVAYGTQEAGGFQDLHKSVMACDDVLQSVDNYLSSFQADLGAVSAEIETLQQRSTTLNKRLAARKQVEKELGPVIDRLIIPPAVIKKLAEGAIDDAYVEALEELRQYQPDDTIMAVQDIKPLVEDVSNKAVERIRDYFAAQIRALRTNVNAQTVQQRAFLRFKSLYDFLASRQPQLADDIYHAYCNTMRWYYQSHFVRYHNSLAAMKLVPSDKHDVIGEDKNSFTLGRRIDVLKPAAALPAHAAEESKTLHHIEVPFVALNTALVDNACFEYLFMTTFFGSSRFQTVFAPVTQLAIAFTKTLISDSFDALGVLLLVRLNQQSAFVLQKRKVPVLESYINGTNLLLWPRFQTILDANCASLKPRPSWSLGQGTAPHPVTQRFANLVQGIISLEGSDDEPVANSLARLRNEYSSFLSKLGKDKQKLVSNNTSLILAILSGAQGRLAEETRLHFAKPHTSL